MTEIRINKTVHRVGILNDFQSYAEGVIREYGIPAISLAVWKENRLHQAAAGLLNRDTGVTATTDSIFQIGSITKLMTASLVMQLADEGKVDLDKPVKSYLRDFQIADPEATDTITVRQLLNHTSGMAGDYFPDDLNDQGNLIARYIDRCNLLPLVHPVGAMFSYSNSAYAVAGRLVEVLRGISWYQAMRDYIFRPLGMNHAIADPRDMIRYRSATGHVKKGGDEWMLADPSYLTLGLAPVGSTPMMSASDLILFARAHMDKEVNQSDENWLSPASVAAMQRPQTQKPGISQVKDNFMGLGWMIEKLRHGPTVIRHAGGTLGFLSNLLIIPAQNTAIAILVNGYKRESHAAITKALMAEIAGFDIGEPDPVAALLTTDDLRSYIGTYDSLDRLIEISLDGQSLKAHVVFKIDPLPPAELTLIPLGKEMFAVHTVEGERSENLCFLRDRQSGSPSFLFMANRLNRRVGSSAR